MRASTVGGLHNDSTRSLHVPVVVTLGELAGLGQIVLNFIIVTLPNL